MRVCVRVCDEGVQANGTLKLARWDFVPKLYVHSLKKSSLQSKVDKITPFVDLLIWWLLNVEL